MNLAGLLPLLWHLPAYGGLVQELRRRASAQGGGRGACRTHAPPVAWPCVLAGLHQDIARPTLVLVPGVEEAKELRDQLESWCPPDTPVLLFPEPDALPYERLPWDSATRSQRLRALAALAGTPMGTLLWEQERRGMARHAPTFAAPMQGDSDPQQQRGFLGGQGDPSQPREGSPTVSPLVVASAHALMAKTMPAEAFRAACHTVEVGMKVAPNALMARWVGMGYGAEHAVEVPGTFSRRGGILDVFSPHSSYPLRIEFFGDEIESLRLFDPATQRSAASVKQASIVPAREIVLSPEESERLGASPESSMPETSTKGEENIPSLPLAGESESEGEAERSHRRTSPSPRPLPSRERGTVHPSPDAFSEQDAEFFIPLFPHGCLLDYVAPDGLLVLADPDRLRGEIEEVAGRGEELRDELTRRGELAPGFPRPYWGWPELAPRLESRSLSPSLSLALEPWAGEEAQGYALGFVSPPSYGGQLPVALAEAADRARKKQPVVIVSHQARRLSDLLDEDHGIFAAPREAIAETPQPGSLTLVQGGLSGGFVMTDVGAPRSIGAPLLTIVTDSELFGLLKSRRVVTRRQPARHLALSELNPGDYVVHVDHGIGRFAGTTTMEVAGTRREYLLVEYAQGDKLYVPIDQMDRIGPYYAVGPDASGPTLSRLGGGEWARAKEKAAESAAKVARELLEVYATRELLPGIAFSPDSAWQQELESSFPFVETPDQLRAVQEVKADMQSARPMDRLVCGDVGYGKTEVALRAAFKAVSDGYQVGVLVPTTVLAQQHYETFRERLAPFPVKVDVLSRFRSPREQDEVLSGLVAGTVDIVIGTHRLLQKDVAFKKLGLVVIDEEHRFGVLHKERLKRMRQEVDALSLSATPIPRTLYMSLVSVRDMSTMETPPEERLPIKTYVSPYKEELVREAILRELDRGGQVFFVHNRVHDIHLVAHHLEELVPEARIVIGHGQMPEEDLETVMLDFASGQADVLVCTTIIEAGLDLPNANTLIIYPADKLGLAQLYQLRGRVGRGRNRAYAYLLFDRSRPLTDTARKRLGTIRDATELGAGFRIAMKDLEIRGAGNLLGTAQHGNIAAVGFDLYCRMLAQAVEELRARMRGEPPPPPPAPAATVDLPLAAHIPEDYVPHLPSRLLLYQRLARPLTPEEIQDIRKEWQDRFGPLPEAVDNLLYMVRVKALATRAGFHSVASENGQIVMRARERLPAPSGGFRPDAIGTPPTLPSGVTVGTSQVRLDTSKLGASWPKALEQVLASLAKATT
ncbi:MAG: transcription-repair coupling factor [Chloroflexi bacterium]|nr:transcription-repair coupling factor [Chloroflexota bacterium]